MRASSLFVVLAAAKVLILAGLGAPMGQWAPLVYFWQDALLALVLALADAAARRPRAGWVVYGAIAAYVAVGVPIAIAAGSPMTWTMGRAARGPLADSIAAGVTAPNVARIALVAMIAIAAPIGLGRLRVWRGGRAYRALARLALVTAVGVMASGPFVQAGPDTAGLDRNAITALVPVALPRVPAPREGIGSDLRRSPFGSDAMSTGKLDSPGEAARLSPLRGSARGFNVLVVVLESAAALYLPAWGGDPAGPDPMPNLTLLSRRAVRFDNAYAVYPESIKGLWSVLCSRSPAFGVPAEDLAARPCDSVAAQLGAAGYRTALFHSGRFRYLGMNSVVAGRGFDVLEDAGAIGGNVESSFGVDEPATVDRLLRWIDSGPPATPFFAVYLPIAGHHPYATPVDGPFPSGTAPSQYRNALHYADDSLGALVSGLRARGVDQRTVLVVFGDHGEAFGQHPGNIGHTMFIHEENVHVPYLIVVPGATDEGLGVTEVASLVDTAPTILDLVGQPAPVSYEGESLLDGRPRMALFLTDYSLGLLGLRDACWKFTFEIGRGRSSLFDVCEDPDETADLAVLETARTRQYRERVLAWQGAVSARRLPRQ